MYFYTEDKERINLKPGKVIGNGLDGTVYQPPDNTCLKLYSSSKNDVNEDVLKLIRELQLKNFYEMYMLLYGKKGNLRAQTMRYYESADIDILTMPVEYTLNSLYNLYNSSIKLADNNIYASDMHSDNVILGSDGITVVDTDLYCFSHVWSGSTLQEKNTNAVRCLFQNLFLDALNTYHSDLNSYTANQRIESIFGMTGLAVSERACSKLVRCKYPIDYIKRGR